MKKASAIIIVASLLVGLTACSNVTETDLNKVVSPSKTGDKIELTILTNSSEYMNIKAEPVLINYIKDFEQKMGVKINFDITDAYGKMLDQKESDEYMKKLAAKLYTNRGPDIIFTEYFFFDNIIKQNVAEEVSSKIPNLVKIYGGLLDDKIYYVPIGMKYYCYGLNSKILNELNIQDPSFNWTQNDFFEIWDKWVSSTHIPFNAAEYFPVYNRYIVNRLDFKVDNNKLSINIQDTIQGIKQARQQILNGSYKLNEAYKYENYYNMIFEENSDEALASQQHQNESRESYIFSSYFGNAFRVSEIAKKSIARSAISLPEFSDKRAYIYTMGFIVNKNSKNQELAYEFINGLLNDENQMSLFNEGDYHYYPVNKDIEDEIRKIESKEIKDSNAIELKKYILQQLENGICDTETDIDHRVQDMENMLYKDLSKYILADNEYSSEELEKELISIVEKYNIWLSE